MILFTFVLLSTAYLILYCIRMSNIRKRALNEINLLINLKKKGLI